MSYQSVLDLKNKIYSTLWNIIGKKCALFDCPYYKNIGDVLIWHGELTFLKDLSKEIVYMCSEKSCSYPKLSHDVTVLFQGGGNIGDIYVNHTTFLSSIIDRYRQNRIVVFPQTVYFKDENLEKKYLNKIARHRDIFFCCRDYKSYEIVSKYMGDRTLLLPDMAFCIHAEDIEQFSHNKDSKDCLLIRRNDIEKQTSIINLQFDNISDWPPFNRHINKEIIINTFFDRFCPIIKSEKLNSIWDSFAINQFRWNMIKMGVNFIDPYRTVYSERLHGAILSILLDKEIIVVDNNYGKNSTFFDSWLKDFNNVSLYKNKQIVI